MSSRKEIVRRTADRVHRHVAGFVRELDLNWIDDLDTIAQLVRREVTPRWVAWGTTRIAMPIGPNLVLKLGDPDVTLDEQRRWAFAKRSSDRSARLMLPIVLQRRGAWSVLPFAEELPKAYGNNLDRLQYQAFMQARALRGLEADLGAENWGFYKRRPVVIDYGGYDTSSLESTRRDGLLNEDGFDGWSVRFATSRDPSGGRHGTGAWAAEKDGAFIHRFSSPSAAWRFVREVRHEGGRRPWRKGEANARGCRVVSIGEDSEHEWIDPWDLFSRNGINMASYEEGLFACVDEHDDVFGVAVAGLTTSGWGDDGPGELRFSVAVDPDRQRRGVGRALVRAVKDYYLEQREDLAAAHGVPWIELVAWVVNPHMAALLEDEGFETDGAEWSESEPHMRWQG